MSWQDTLLDASYKGVAFEATGDTLRGVHALAEHSYPFVDGSDIEDTGCEALEFNLTAVLYGDDYEARLQRLLKVLREHGSGELVHPIYGSVPDTVVSDFEVRHSEDSPDYAEINISFKQSVAAAPFFGRELALALADEADWVADLAAFQGFAVLEKGLGKIRNLQQRWNNFHAAVLNVVGRLYGQVNGVFSGSLNLLNSPRVLLTELKGVFGALAGMHRTAGSSLSGWRDLAGGTKQPPPCRGNTGRAWITAPRPPARRPPCRMWPRSRQQLPLWAAPRWPKSWRIFSPPSRTSPNSRRRKSAACWPMCAPSSTARWPPTAWR